MSVIWKKFNALGTEIVITADLNLDQVGLLDSAEELVNDFEKKFSRFIKDNELAKFNEAPQGEVIVSQEMLTMIKEVQRWQQFSQGIFDPTVITNLEKLGYSKSFTEIDEAANSLLPKPNLEQLQQDFKARPKLEDLVIVDHRVIKSAGLRLDFGGFGKGYIVDKIGQELFKDVNNFWFSAGGDLLAAGNTSSQAGWKIGVQNPHEPTKEIFRLDTKGQKLGVATSGIFQRQGKIGGVSWYHLIDPRTGLSVENNILAVTALAPNATQADILAKTILILGEKDGLDFVEQITDSAALLFLKNGGIVLSSQVKNYL